MQLKMSSRLQTVINLTTGIFTMLVSLVINFFLSSYASPKFVATRPSKI